MLTLTSTLARDGHRPVQLRHQSIQERRELLWILAALHQREELVPAGAADRIALAEAGPPAPGPPLPGPGHRHSGPGCRCTRLKRSRSMKRTAAPFLAFVAGDRLLRGGCERGRGWGTRSRGSVVERRSRVAESRRSLANLRWRP